MMTKWKREYVCISCMQIRQPLQMENPKVCKGCYKRFNYISIGKSNWSAHTTTICNHHWPFDCTCR